MFFVLRGKVALSVKDKTYHLCAEDIVLINKNEMHKITSVDDGALIISLFINPYYYEAYYTNFSEIYFECNTLFDDANGEKYSFIRNKLSSIMVSLMCQHETYQFTMLSESLKLIEHLVKNFRKDDASVDVISDDYLHQRFIRILEYLNKHYDERITLSELAKKEYISVYYLSRLFKSQMNIGFNKYLNLLRLDKSMYDLVNTSKSILEIAIDSGFASAKAYRTVFKENYDMSPNEYRKQMSIVESSAAYEKVSLPIDSSALMLILQKYQSSKVEEFANKPKIVNVQIDTVTCTKKQWTSFEKILYFDFVYDGLNLNWQQNLEKIHNEIHFDYIRFSGIFSQGMYFYNSKEKLYNWFNVDNLLDFFVQKNIKPFLKLTYNEKDFSIRNWHSMLENFLHHCIERYGLSTIREWKFEFAHQDKSYSKMIELYTLSLDYFCDKFNKLNFGIEFVPSSNFHEEYFLINFKSKKLSFITVEMSEDMYREMSGFVRILLRTIKSNMALNTYFIKIESNSYFNDTCYKANKLIHDFLVEHSGFDTQVNFIDNLETTKLFHGGRGLLTYNGLKKPVYHAYYLLSKLKGNLISKGPFHYAVENDKSIVILFYNNLEKLDDILQSIDYYERGKDLAISKSTLFELKILIEKGKYKLKSYTLDRSNGSIFDEWLNMGKPEYFDTEDFNFIKSKEMLRLKSLLVSVEDSISLEFALPSDGVKLINLTKL
ncbi:putative HTH-type transcriptional regulator [Peptoclostridium acidaminophilum DSM 3953]|uniref:Putative HTH-type transcriptional regulator n=2 Tax=Peptoclostridium acidaminophilum TaxID=1731 RepID=W8T5D7_PEPAC|nr:putative HTH-type transcriptional regulator [Peptoclostridium acidaminophilum DSM 3953]